jgi:hypothetical protein
MITWWPTLRMAPWVERADFRLLQRRDARGATG